MFSKVLNTVNIQDIHTAHVTLENTVNQTPLHRDEFLSNFYNCNIYLKREDLQVTRSFKIRGAYNLIKNLSTKQLKNGIICASAGNHAQGVAYTCNQLKTKGKIFMPITTPHQKVAQVQLFGGSYVETVLIGDTFDDALQVAQKYCKDHQMFFIHPFDDPHVIAGQGTIAIEILNQIEKPIDYIFTAIGGGGLASGIGTYIKEMSPHTQIVGVESYGAPSMRQAFIEDNNIILEYIDNFVDGTAVKQVGNLTFKICKRILDDITLVCEGQVCTTILELYMRNAIVAEPAGAISIAALDTYKEKIKGKTVVCILSGGNNDIERIEEIKERSLIYKGLRHYFSIEVPQKSSELKGFFDKLTQNQEDIIRFEYIKKNNKRHNLALVGIELKNKEDYEHLILRLNKYKIRYIELNKNPDVLQLLI
ncbi:threonine ammonia-lyase IlvA [Bacillus cereus]|uniref:L-threonine dehydratase n=1 Tax=Bacillus cereus TaxID=1396 RepID=A0A9X8IW64_BACCE|nr:threonine ammonia-lyase IlvA [Bacillus cereus]RWQ71110.1 threonine dehydratase [Bacillus cereus]